jgi:hypothetical protein
MTNKQIFGLVILMLLVPIIGDIGRGFVDSFTQEHLIYRNEPLPPFQMHQDYKQTPYAPVVRLSDVNDRFFCSGSVISNDYVVTAAHCVMDTHNFVPGLHKGVIRVTSLPGANGLTIERDGLAGAANTRADYALIKGDFSDFTKIPMTAAPMDLMRIQGPILTCGFPWSAELACYPAGNGFLFYDMIGLQGRLFPGMSGGPVIDLSGLGQFAVNSGVINGAIIVAPLTGLFASLGIKVDP